MKFRNQFTKRLNLNICPKTYEKINEVATMEGRKTGNMARRILDQWAKNREAQTTDRKEKI